MSDHLLWHDASLRAKLTTYEYESSDQPISVKVSKFAVRVNKQAYLIFCNLKPKFKRSSTNINNSCRASISLWIFLNPAVSELNETYTQLRGIFGSDVGFPSVNLEIPFQDGKEVKSEPNSFRKRTSDYLNNLAILHLL